MSAEPVSLEKALCNFLDETGRLKQLPAKRGMKLLACEYLQGKLEKGKRYTEKELGEALDGWTRFHDPATLRREMYDARFLNRERDGSVYWVEQNAEKPETH